MEFIFTPEDARTTAERVGRYYQRKRYAVEIETAYAADAPYRTTLIARRREMPTILVEAQAALTLLRPVEDLARWLAAERSYCELYLAVDSEGSLPGQTLANCMKLGIGILIAMPDESLQEVRRARNPALIVTPDPNLKLGKLKTRVKDLVQRFNDGDRKEAFRDLCEVIERETEVLLEKLLDKNRLTLTLGQIHGMSWENQINALNSGNSYAPGFGNVLTAKDIADLQAFRGARNLVDHRVRSQKQEAERDRQLGERMMLGARLAEVLTGAQRSIR